jgi:hypothetical protein
MNALDFAQARGEETVMLVSAGGAATWRSIMVVLGSRREGLYFTGHRVEVKFQRVMCGMEGGLKAYFWWIESVLETVMDHTCSNIISRDHTSD